MFVAQQLLKKNIAEYLLYMWQVEDILRANGCDYDTLQRNYLSRFNVPADEKKQLCQWYADLVDMMHHEGVVEQGHLQICKNVLSNLEELHAKLLGSARYPQYKAAYYKVLPYIVEVRSKDGGHDVPELETCFNTLYGVMLLRLQKKPVSDGTEKAARDISAFLASLSQYYKKDKETPLEF